MIRLRLSNEQRARYIFALMKPREPRHTTFVSAGLQHTERPRLCPSRTDMRRVTRTHCLSMMEPLAYGPPSEATIDRFHPSRRNDRSWPRAVRHDPEVADRSAFEPAAQSPTSFRAHPTAASAALALPVNVRSGNRRAAGMADKPEFMPTWQTSAPPQAVDGGPRMHDRWRWAEHQRCDP